MASSKTVKHANIGLAEQKHRASAADPTPLPAEALSVSDGNMRPLSIPVPHREHLTSAAKAATVAEHSMTVREAASLYPKAILYSMGLSLALVMEGYDLGLLLAFFGLPQFNRKFGVPVGDETYQLTSTWQSGLMSGAQIGQILGLIIAGYLADRFGYRRTIVGALVLMMGLVFLFFFAKNIGMLFAAEVLAGIPWGAFQTLTTTYAADVTPIALRPILTTFVNLCWVTGNLISGGVLRGLLRRQDQWAWRIPYAIQWVWPVPILIAAIFAPESPNWLVRNGRIEEAQGAIRRLTSKKFTAQMVEDKLVMIQHTNALESQMGAGMSYLDCFRGTNLRRTEIACVVWVCQVFCGFWFGVNVTYFLEQAGGLSPEKAFDFGIGTDALSLVATACTWFILQRVGRRTLYLTGLSVMLIVLLVVGFLGIPGISSTVAYVSGVLMMVFVITYDLTVGPICYCLVAEIPSTRLRVKTVVLARSSYNIAGLCATFLNAPILNPIGWNLRGKGGLVWCGFCLSCLVWTYFRLPEPKGLSSAEMDVLFEKKVSARKFRCASNDPFGPDYLNVADEMASLHQIRRADAQTV